MKEKKIREEKMEKCRTNLDLALDIIDNCKYKDFKQKSYIFF